MKRWSEAQISPHLVYFCEEISAHVNYVMWLVLGSQRSIMVDTGIGLISDLHVRAQRYTAHGIDAVLTHSDPDHVGHAHLFPRVYLAQEDLQALPFAQELSCRLGCIARAAGEESACYADAQRLLRAAPVLTPLTLAHGDCLDLGDRRLEIFALPGHTPGSLCLIDDTLGIAFVGDAITRFPLLNFPRCTALEVYYEALTRFHARTKGMQLLCGHGVHDLGAQAVEDILQGCGEILRGDIAQDAADTMPTRFSSEELCVLDRRIHLCGSVGIRYSAAKRFLS